MKEQQSIVITGASTGIGWATTQVLLGKGFRVFGMVRKQNDADRLRAEFGSNFWPLLADVTDEEAISRAVEQVSKMLGKSRLAGLVNNAGIVVGGPLLHLDAAELRRQMEVNLIGPFQVSKAFAPLLGADPSRHGQPGRIVQMSSVVGVLGIPFVGPYVASKFALEGMSESLRRELLLYGIDVIVVGPGAVATPIWEKAAAEDYSRFDSTEYGPMIRRFMSVVSEDAKKGLSPDEIGRTVYHALTAKNPKVRYAVVPQRFKNWTLPRLLPKRVLDRLLGKQLGLSPRQV